MYTWNKIPQKHPCGPNVCLQNTKRFAFCCNKYMVLYVHITL